MRLLVAANIGLMILFPIAWSAPLMRAGLLPIFGLSEISVLSGLASLWDSDRALAVIVALFAIIAPYAKTLALLAVQTGLAPARFLQPLHWLGRLAMADVFLIAIYITVAKGVGVGRIETAWGLYLFTFLILASITLAHLTDRRLRG
jgi:uncharacterized paraquat-inducible protein A